MNTIEIRNESGEVEKRELSKSQPISIGKHRSNDICIDDKTVAAMHCRISWNKTTYEVTAASADGVDVNGSFVRHWLLSHGDVIRVGSYDITLIDDDERGKAIEAAKSWVDLKPITADSFPIYLRRSKPTAASDLAEMFSPPAKKETSPKPDSQKVQRHEEVQEDGPEPDSSSMLQGMKGLAEQAESSVDLPATKPATTTKRVSAYSRLKLKLTAPPRRPGEQDVLRSPLVLILGGGSVVLLLMAATFWFIISRETVQRQFDAAVKHKQDGDYSQAIRRFEEFLQMHPNHKYTEPARIELALTRIEKEINGSKPNWRGGLAALIDFIDRHRDSSAFQDQHPAICDHSRTIALGASQSAEDNKQRELLKVSGDARVILEGFSPLDAPPTEDLKLIARMLRTAEAAVLKQETLDAAIAEIERAHTQKRPMDALVARRRLLARYADLSSNSRIVELRKTTLETERQLIGTQKIDRTADKNGRNVDLPPPLSLTLHTRSRSAEVSQNRTVFAYAQGCCYGIDSVTGNVNWRRVIGLDTPFFPMRVETSVPAVLLFDTNKLQLLLLNRHTGEVVWSQSIGEDVSGAPLVNEGQIFLPSLEGHLYGIDLETGRVRTQLKFSQKLRAPPALLSDGRHFVTAGDEEVLYTLSMRPLKCVSVSYLGHKTGSIEAPIVTMGKLLLVSENQRESCLLHVVDTRNSSGQLKPTSFERLDGLVREAPILRGNQLFVPSSLERITAFIVSDEKDHKPLTRVAQYHSPTNRKVPLHLAAGADGQLWMAGSTLSKFHLTTDSLKLEPNQIQIGLSSQPLQSMGDDLFVGRRLQGSGAVVFMPANRDDLSSHWKTVLGTSILAVIQSANESLLCLTSEGDLFGIGALDLKAGGLKYRPVLQLKPSESLDTPLQAVQLADGRLAVHSGNPEPKLWIVNSQAQIEHRFDLEQPLEANPVLLGSHLVLPYPGFIKVVGVGEASAVEVFPADVEKDQRRKWTSLKSLDEAHMIVADNKGKLSRFQFRNEPAPPHLVEVVRVERDDPLDVGFLIEKDRVIIADAGKRLQVLDSSNLAPVAETNLEKSASNDLWLLDNYLLIETGRDRLNCFDTQQGLKRLWSIPLEEQIAGKPLRVDRQLIFAAIDGEIVAADLKTGDVERRMRLDQLISIGPWKIGEMILVGSIDGTLYRIESILETDQ